MAFPTVAIAMLTLLKFSTHDCHACQSMASIDSKVAAELGLAFVDVDMRDTELYRRFRHVLLRQHPGKSAVALPSYFLMSDQEGDAQVHAELVGAMPEPEFRSHLESLIRAVNSVTVSAAPAGSDG
jgi:hypothetical protein